MSRRIDCAGPGRHGALHHQHVLAVGGQLLDHGADPREVGVAGVGRRRVDADEEQPGALEQLAISVVKVSRSALRATAPRGPARGSSPRRARATRPSREDVAGDDRVAELGEAGGGDQADPADPDHAYRLFWSLIALLLPLWLLLRDRSRLPSGRSRSSDRWSTFAAGRWRSSRRCPPVPGHHLYAFAVDVDVVVAAVDGLGQARVVEDRRVRPPRIPCTPK